ncbi:MAG: virulence RhuM family protein [Leptospiraceae bacterium]|nr:virulence RhuM family protein [Leptospiraceae bacterium]
MKSKIATRFRQWATEKLKEYINKAAEIIHERADSSQPNMGLTNWRGEKIRKQDVSVAKNYLNENELLALNNLVEQYLVFAEGQGLLLG